MSDTHYTPKSGEKIAFLGILANIFLTTIKALWGIFGNSYALIADAIESASDIVGSLVVFFGVRLAQKPVDENHPYGHGKIEPLAGFVVSLILLIAVYEIFSGALHRIRFPEDAGLPALWTLWILVFVVVLKWTLFLRATLIGKSLRSTAVQWDAFHHLSDAVTTAIALVGTLLALFAGASFQSAADWAALLASFFMLYNAFHIGYPAIRELLDEAVDSETESKIGELLKNEKNIKNINACIVRKSGFDRIVELHIQVDGARTVREWHLIAHEVTDTIQSAIPEVINVIVHVEPDYKVVA